MRGDVRAEMMKIISEVADENNFAGVSFVAIYRRMSASPCASLSFSSRRGWRARKRRRARARKRPLQIDSGAETGLVNWSRRFRDRMLLMIGNFRARYVREPSFVRRVYARRADPFLAACRRLPAPPSETLHEHFSPQLNPSNLYGNHGARGAIKSED